MLTAVQQDTTQRMILRLLILSSSFLNCQDFNNMRDWALALTHWDSLHVLLLFSNVNWCSKWYLPENEIEDWNLNEIQAWRQLLRHFLNMLGLSFIGQQKSWLRVNTFFIAIAVANYCSKWYLLDNDIEQSARAEF